jgi:imidazolonepropionase
MSLLITNIKSLLQVRDHQESFIAGEAMNVLPSIEHAYVLIKNDTIVDYGPMHNIDGIEADETLDASGCMVLPTWCDSHSHIVYAGNRVGEFVDRIHGLSYEEIAARGGGILNSAKTLQNTSEEDLYEQAIVRVEEVMQQGTGALEIKSGYGLTLEAELKMLRVIQRIKKDFPIKIKATFLAAHALPTSYNGDTSKFIDTIITTWIPAVTKAELADYIDIFCEEGYFTVEDTNRLLEAAAQYNLQGKIHVNQFNAIGGVSAGVTNKARSVDHLEELTIEDIKALNDAETIPVALPGCSYFLSIPYTPARKLIDAGLPLALATDYNPGSAPSGNMNFIVSAACIKMKMTPAEAINAATINGAYAMGIEQQYGSITRGKKANLIITKPMAHYAELMYNFGDDPIEKVIINGQPI